MSDLLDIRTWSILQWVLVVLAAGFIGQFGKSFAQFIIAKLNARRAAGKKGTTLPVPIASGKMMPETSASPNGERNVATEPTCPDRDISSAKDILSDQSMPPVLDKKTLKAVLKQKKKAGKVSK